MKFILLARIKGSVFISKKFVHHLQERFCFVRVPFDMWGFRN